MRAEALVAGAGARGRAVLLKAEAGTVTGMTSNGDKRGDVLIKTVSGSGRARADGDRSLGGSDIEAEGVGVLKSGIAKAEGSTCRQALRQIQEACSNTGLTVGRGNFN